MATVISGTRKNQQVRIMELDGELALLESGRYLRLGMLQADQLERTIIAKHYAASETFQSFDFDHFMATGLFKRRKAAA